MSFVTKRMSKKMLSVILALMILVSAVSVAFSAIANAAAAPYVVTEGKPAIAMLSGQTIDLNKINVEFGIEEVPGEEITWAATPDSAIIFDATAKTLTVLKPGAFTLTATKTSDTSKTRTVNVFATAEATTEVPLYEHTFTADDVADGDFTAASEWKVVKNGTGALEYNAAGFVGVSGNATSAYFILDPQSKSGGVISNYADYALEMQLYSSNYTVPNNSTVINQLKTALFFGPMARVTYASNTDLSAPETVIMPRIRYCNARFTPSAFGFNVSGNTDGTNATLTGLNVPVGTTSNYKMVLSGKNVDVYWDIDGQGYDKLEGYTFSTAQETALDAAAGVKGTIGFYREKAAAVGLASVKAYINFTQTELDKIQNACTDSNLYFVSKNKPAIQMLSGKTLDLNRVVVEFDDDSVALGSQVTWTMVGNDAAILDTSNGNSLTVFKSGTYELTATSTANTENKKKIYVFAVDSLGNEVALMDYAFTLAEVEGVTLPATIGEKAVFGADNSWMVCNLDSSGPVSFATAYGEGWNINNNTDAIVMLNPESNYGKLVSSFKDYIIDFTAAVPSNVYKWGNSTSSDAADGYVNFYGRYNVTDNEGTPAPANDTFVGYRQYYSNAITGSFLKSGNTSAGAGAIFAGYDYSAGKYTMNMRLKLEGNTATYWVKNANDASFGDPLCTLTDDTLTNESGVVGYYSRKDLRPLAKNMKVSISFTDKELETIGKCYIDNNYYVVSAAKPAIPVKINTKINLDNIVVEIADGEFMLGTDIAWESTSGALVYDEATNSVSAYRKGNTVLKAKKSASDTEGRDIYFLIDDEVNAEVDLYSYEFAASDVGTADANGIYAFGSNAAEKPWKFYTSPNTAVAWSAGGVANGTGIANGIYAVVNSGINIGAAAGYLVLNPESAEGKLISSMADITIVYRATIHPNFTTWNSKTAKIAGRYQMAGATPSFAADAFLGYNAPWSNATKGGMVYTGNVTHVGNAIANPNYEIVDMEPFAGATKKIVEGDLDFKMQYKGEDFIFSVKGADSDDSGYTTLYTMSSDASAPAAAKATAGHGGTFAMYTDSNIRVTSQYFRASVNFDEAELQKLVATDVAALYNLTQDYPAVPVKAGHKILLKDLLVELPNGEFITGDKLDWSCAYVGSNFFIDNDEKAVYAYREGRYDVTIKNGDADVNLVHFIVSGDGVYRLFNHTFTKADADAMAATGKSDMWIASFHSHTNEPAGSFNGTGTMPNAWQKDPRPLTLGSNAQFDENKGISLYNNCAMLLTLNPEHPEAKIISKFRNYNIDFTSSARDKNVTNSGAHSIVGSVGAIGRIDFGTNGNFDFIYSRYLKPYNMGVLDTGRVSINPGVPVPFARLDADGDNITWTCEKQGITIDADAKTITVNEPGIYHVVGTRADSTTKTVSFIGNNIIDHHILGAFRVQTGSSYVTIGTPEGKRVNNLVSDTTFTRSLTNSFQFNVPDTYNFRVALNGNNMAMYVAANGTTNYNEVYNTAADTGLDAALKGSIAQGNVKSGTIALFSDGGSRAWFKSVAVSLEFDAFPTQTSLGECYEEDSRLIYLEVGQVFDLTKANFEAGNRYHNGANITFSNVPAGLEVVNGVSITPRAIGDYTLKGKGTDGTNITISVAVSAAGAIYDNGNYQFTVTDGIITAYNRKDEAKPYSAFVRFPSEYDGKHVYELGGALALGNANNKQLVAIEVEKYIEKIGAGAFLDATKLEKVTLPNTIESIGSSAFAGTTALKEIFLPASVSEIGESAFRYNPSLVVTIANKDAVIADNAFTAGATIKGYAGGSVEAWANANGINFVALTGADKDAADASVADWEQIVYDRYNKVNTSVEWTLHSVLSGGRMQYSIVGFKFTDRSAGKFVLPKELKVTVDGKEQTVSVNPGSAAMADCVDSRAVYAIEIEEGVTSIGFWAFRGCYNLRDVKLPKTLTGIAQQTFKDCSSLEKIDIPKAVVTLGLYAFENCTNLKEVNVHPDSMLQAIGTNAVRKTEVPGRILYNTKVEKFVFPVSVDWITNSVTNFAPKLNEVWIYNKDCLFTIATDGQQYYFNRGTIIHGVPGSTAEELVKADQALGAGNPNYRGLVFVGDLEDFYEVNEGVKHEDGFFSGDFMEYDPDPTKEGAWVEKENPYYAITKYTGKGGSVVMPAYLDIRGQKNVPIYAVSAKGFQFETVPTGGLPKIINLEISEGIAVIEDEAFNGAIHMKSVKLPSTLIKIGAKAFVGTSIEGKLEIPKNVAEIGNAAFRSNPNLTDVVILNPNTVIGGGVFDPSITIHGVKGSTAEAYATKNKIKFVEIAAPAQSTVADFSDNGNYKLIVTDGYITGYERLDASKPYSQKVTVPATIDGVAIKGVAAGAFDKGAEATSVMAIELQEGITEIPKEAFKGLIKLSRVSFPKTLKTIGESAFEATALNGEITLPESLEKVEKNAFKNLNNITAITVLSKTVVIDPAGLPRLNKEMKVYGYTGSTAEEWAKSVKWQNFEYLDAGPSEEPGEEPEKPQEGNKGDEPTEDPIEGDGGVNKVIRVIRQSNLALVIVIAVSMLLLAVILAAVVVVIVVVKKKRDEEAGL